MFFDLPRFDQGDIEIVVSALEDAAHQHRVNARLGVLQRGLESVKAATACDRFAAALRDTQTTPRQPGLAAAGAQPFSLGDI